MSTKGEKFINDQKACHWTCIYQTRCKKIPEFYRLLSQLKRCTQLTLFQDIKEAKIEARILYARLLRQAQIVKSCYVVKKRLEGKGYRLFRPSN